MEDKILIKSEMDKKAKRFLALAPIISFAITLICVIVLSRIYTVYGWRGYTVRTGWEIMFDFGGDTETLCFIYFILLCLSFIFAVVSGIIYLANRKCEMSVTENNVKGKTLFGKEVVLPMYMISAYSTRKFLSTITVATASGMTKFALLGNYKEIGQVLAQKINERQQNTETAPKTIAVPTAATANNNMDDLVKLKSLLDAGIITQDEFDEKKKQLLDL